MSKLLNNIPIEDLTEDNDYLGIIGKGQIIKTFLESNTDEFSEIKMFSLYGEWGSGKSTLMKYLQKELKGNFNTFFFEAWQYESDDNLSLSLLEYLSYETSDSTDEVLGEIVEVAAKLFRGFSKSMRISVPGFSIDGSKIVESLEEEPKETFYQLKIQFQKEFKSWENTNTVKGKPKFNIVFIDDLDRCEPENVLNLLSALKLFFTYGEKTIFFCGIDKKAVDEAVKTKYHDVVKSGEYLEKIFDISFNMPKHDEIFKLLNHYFKDLKLEDGSSLTEKLVLFFNSLEFTNPRKIKKVLNKFLMLESIRKNLHKNQSSLSVFPKCINEHDGTFFETILVLYFILALEFNPTALESIFNLKEKQLKYYNDMKDQINSNNLGSNVKSLNDLTSNDLVNKPLNVFGSENHYKNVMFTFAPIEINVPYSHIFRNIEFERIKTKGNTTQYKFFKYLIENLGMFSSSNNFSDVTLTQIMNTIKKTI